MADRTRLSKTRRLEYAQAATRAFAKRGGYHGATLNDIAIEAGVTQPRISQVYGHKLDAFLEAYEFATGALLESWAEYQPKPDESGWESQLGQRYRASLPQDRDKLLVVQYAISAASKEQRVGEAVRQFTAQLWQALTTERKLSPEQAANVLARALLLQFGLATATLETEDEAPEMRGFASAVAPASKG